MNVTAWIYATCAVICVFAILAAAYTIFGKNRQNAQRGSTPGQNATLLATVMDTGSGGHVGTVRMPQDPQDYTKVMTPQK